MTEKREPFVRIPLSFDRAIDELLAVKPVKTEAKAAAKKKPAKTVAKKKPSK